MALIRHCWELWGFSPIVSPPQDQYPKAWPPINNSLHELPLLFSQGGEAKKSLTNNEVGKNIIELNFLRNNLSRRPNYCSLYQQI
jgi:hypothetical protein